MEVTLRGHPPEQEASPRRPLQLSGRDSSVKDLSNWEQAGLFAGSLCQQDLTRSANSGLVPSGTWGRSPLRTAWHTWGNHKDRTRLQHQKNFKKTD